MLSVLAQNVRRTNFFFLTEVFSPFYRLVCEPLTEQNLKCGLVTQNNIQLKQSVGESSFPMCFKEFILEAGRRLEL